jgi:hypothetical protein
MPLAFARRIPDIGGVPPKETRRSPPMRLAGLILVALALVALGADLSQGEVASLGERWAELHRSSLIGLQSGLENRVHPDAFFDYVLPVLELPAAACLAVPGLALLLLARLRRR